MGGAVRGCLSPSRKAASTQYRAQGVLHRPAECTLSNSEPQQQDFDLKLHKPHDSVTTAQNNQTADTSLSCARRVLSRAVPLSSLLSSPSTDLLRDSGPVFGCVVSHQDT